MGVVLDHGGPWGVAFDERVPGQAGSTVVVAEWVRRMKRGLSEGEFMAVVREEWRHLRTGRPFRRDSILPFWGKPDHRYNPPSLAPEQGTFLSLEVSQSDYQDLSVIKRVNSRWPPPVVGSCS